jgi:hypothetical protein
MEIWNALHGDNEDKNVKAGQAWSSLFQSKMPMKVWKVMSCKTHPFKCAYIRRNSGTWSIAMWSGDIEHENGEDSVLGSPSLRNL